MFEFFTDKCNLKIYITINEQGNTAASGRPIKSDKFITKGAENTIRNIFW